MEVEAKRLEEPEAVDDTKETASPGHNRTDTYMSSGTGTAHTPAQVQTWQNPSTGKGKWTRSPTHNQEAFRNWCSPNPSKEKIYFICSQSVTRFIPILQGRPRAWKYFPTQSRLYWFSGLVWFCYYFLSQWFSLCVCLSVWNKVWVLLSIFFWWGRSIGTWVSTQLGGKDLGKAAEEKEYYQNTLGEKIFFKLER